MTLVGGAMVTGKISDYVSWVTGDRTAAITVTTSASLLSTATTGLINGSFLHDTTNSAIFANGLDNTNEWLQFDFATAKLVRNARWFASASTACGNWKWQGSNDASGWTDIGGAFALGPTDSSGVDKVQTMPSLAGNTTYYRYYRMLGTGGTKSSGPWLVEVEFLQS